MASSISAVCGMLAPPMAAASSMCSTAFFSILSSFRCRWAFPSQDRQTVFQSPSLPPYLRKFFSVRDFTCWHAMHCLSLGAAIMGHLSNCMMDASIGPEVTPPCFWASWSFSCMFCR